jgi:hypothetical protein
MKDLSAYMSVRHQMKTGDLLQWHSNSLIGAIIRWRTHSNVNHSSLVLRLDEYAGKEDRRWTTEALEHGTVVDLLSRRLADYDGSVWWYPLRDELEGKRKSIGEKALELIGVPYDYGSIIKQIFGRVSANARRLFCSEYCYISYGYSGKAPTPADMPNLGIFKAPIKIY